MSEKNITYAALGIAVIAIVIAAASMLVEQDMDDFVSISQHKLVLDKVTDRVTELENAVHISCDKDVDCLAGLSIDFASTEMTNKLVDLIGVEAELMIQFKEKIVANSDKIADNHPYDFEPEELPVESEVVVFSTLLKLELEKPTWIQGEDIVFTGNAMVNAGQVRITITEPDGNIRFLNAVVHDDGSYTFRYITDFDSQLGEYSVFVEQRSRISQTILFTVITVE